MRRLSFWRLKASQGKRVFVASALGVGLLAGSLLPQSTLAYEFELSDAADGVGGLTASVTYSGNGVNLRSEPSIYGEVLAKLPEGSVVELRIDQVDTVYDEDGDRWWPVRFDGVDGWVIGFYLDGQGSSSSTSGSAALGVTPSFDPSVTVAVVTDDGGGLNMRADAGAEFEAIGKLAFGEVVEVIDGPYYDSNGDGWYLITDGAKRAFVIGAYLQETSATSAQGNYRFSNGDYAAANGTLNVRSGPDVGSGVVGQLKGGEAVQVVSGPVFDNDGDGWYLVETDDFQGYAITTYLLESSASAAAPASGGLIYPLAKYTFTQSFGCSPYAFEPYDAGAGCNYHNGIDLAASSYTPVRAAESGTVVQAGWCDCGLGYYVRIDHGDGIETVYGHMAESPYVSVGDVVSQGDVVGPVGSTGLSTGPHVHFMVIVNGATVDPMGYL